MTTIRTVSAVLITALATTAVPALAQGNDYDPRYADVQRAPTQGSDAYGQSYADYERARAVAEAARATQDGHNYVLREDLADYRDVNQGAYQAAAYDAPSYNGAAYDNQANYDYGAARAGANYDPRSGARGVPQYEAPQYQEPTYNTPQYDEPEYEAPRYRAQQHSAPRHAGVATGRISPHLGYTMEQREAWLGDCRRLYAKEDNHGERDGLIGSLLGALIGGVAGNRIGGVGERLGGTLIGAGVGGLAGAVIGGLFSGGGSDDDDDRGYGEIDECESYLLRYERSAATNPGGQYGSYGQQAGYAHQNVQWIRVPIHSTRNGCNRCGEEVIVEEWIEEEVVARPKARRIVRRAPPAPKKTKRIKYVK